jgi:hypothetical protein
MTTSRFLGFRWMRPGFADLLVLCCFAACARGSNRGDGRSDAGADDAAATDDSDDDGSIQWFGDGGPRDTGTSHDGGSCPPEATLVYVTGQSAELWSFWPPTFTFKKIGDLTCTSNPTHMTVDRLGNAWVVGDGNIYKTSTKDATCSLLPTWTPHPPPFWDFAVSLVGLTSTDHTLYLLGQTVLASFDIVTGTFTTVGTLASWTAGDMTSNGDGTLYALQGFIVPHPLYNIAPSNAAVLKTYSVDAAGTGDQALAYFGGRFYAFEDNVVNEYDPKTNAVKPLGNAPLLVTGAGQSTCVPQVPIDAGPPR